MTAHSGNPKFLRRNKTLWFHSLSDQHGHVQIQGMILITLVRVPEHHCGDASGNPNRIWCVFVLVFCSWLDQLAYEFLAYLEAFSLVPCGLKGGSFGGYWTLRRHIFSRFACVMTAYSGNPKPCIIDEKQTLWFHSLSDQHGYVQVQGMILIALVRVPEHHCGDASGNPNRIWCVFVVVFCSWLDQLAYDFPAYLEAFSWVPCGLKRGRFGG